MADRDKAKRADVVVIGGGIAGLVSALELADRGFSVIVIEAAETVGGALAQHSVGGLTLDAGAESFATRNTATRTLIEELGLADAIETPERTAWIQYPGEPASEHARELPVTGMLGIPADPESKSVTETIGAAGALLALKDHVAPTKKIAAQRPLSLAQLVEARMGKAVLDKLVRPIVAGVYSAEPEDLDADLALPGIRKRLVDAGSLAKAVASMRQAAPAGSAVGSLKGGMHTLVKAVDAALRERGVTILTDTAAHTLEREGEEWVVTIPSRGKGAADAHVVGNAVVLALPEAEARTLLTGILEVPGDDAETPEIHLVTLVVDKPELDTAPRGSGVIVAEGAPVQAKALTHASAKWEWLREEAGPGTHVIRLSYGKQGDGVDYASWDAQTWRDTALADASVLLDTELTGQDVLDWDRVSWQGAQPSARLGHAARAAAIREAAHGVPGLALTGAWLAGTGLARVIPDARARAEALAESLGAPLGEDTGIGDTLGGP